MVLSWSRAIYVEFVRRADTASFIQSHANAFEYFGGVPRRCLYYNTKVVTLLRDGEGRTEWNRRMLDFSLRLGFELKLCQPYRAHTKGKVESGVKYVRGPPQADGPAFGSPTMPTSTGRPLSGATPWPTGGSTVLLTRSHLKCWP